MHNAHARKVFVMHITDASSNEIEGSMVPSFTRRICAFVFTCVLRSVMVFIEISFAEESIYTTSVQS